MVSYFTLPESPRDPVVWLQARPVETRYTWNGTHTIERGEKGGVQFLQVLAPCPFD